VNFERLSCSRATSVDVNEEVRFGGLPGLALDTNITTSTNASLDGQRNNDTVGIKRYQRLNIKGLDICYSATYVSRTQE